MRVQNFSFQAGQTLKVQIEELLGPSTLIVSYRGHLLRVKNESNFKLQVGDFVDLRVARQNPLELQILRPPSDSFSYDRRV